jgi:hypothetical protein
VPGTPGNLIHGNRSARHAEAVVIAARAALAERLAEIESDQGGDLSRLKRDGIERYLATTAMIEWLEARLLAEGTMTSRGRKRAALDGYLSLLDRAIRLASMIGLDRRTKPAPTLAQYLESKRAAEAAKP